MSLFAKLSEKSKSLSTAVVETAEVVISVIKDTKRSDTVMLVLKDGTTMFAFRNVFQGGIPVEISAEGLKAIISLVEKGEFINIVGISYSLEDLGKRAYLATSGIAYAGDI